MMNTAEISVLKELARQYAAIAALPVHREKRDLWAHLNNLSMDRPMVLIDQLPWHEMDVDGSLACRVSDPYWRGVETWLRRAIYQWKHFPVDRVWDPYLCLPRPISHSGWGLKTEQDLLASDVKNDVVSHRYHNQIENEEDLEKIHTPVYTLDEAVEQDILQTAHELFDGILPFRMTGVVLHCGIWDSITEWMGIENCYIELMDRPEMLHALMEKLTVGLLSMTDQLDRLGGFDVTSNLCHCSQTYLTDASHAGDEPPAPLAKNAWTLGLAQLFTSVSPAVTDEFEVAYMQRVFARFGAVYYGCCDRLDDRLDVIEKLPNVRKLSCSPWSDRERFAQNLDRSRYVMSNKPTPAYLAADVMDEKLVRDDLRRTLDAARRHDVCLEFILKDISTVCGKPQHVWRWAEIAMEEVCR